MPGPHKALDTRNWRPKRASALTLHTCPSEHPFGNAFRSLTIWLAFVFLFYSQASSKWLLVQHLCTTLWIPAPSSHISGYLGDSPSGIEKCQRHHWFVPIRHLWYPLSCTNCAVSCSAVAFPSPLGTQASSPHRRWCSQWGETRA